MLLHRNRERWRTRLKSSHNGRTILSDWFIDITLSFDFVSLRDYALIACFRYLSRCRSVAGVILFQWYLKDASINGALHRFTSITEFRTIVTGETLPSHPRKYGDDIVLLIHIFEAPIMRMTKQKGTWGFVFSSRIIFLFKITARQKQNKLLKYGNCSSSTFSPPWSSVSPACLAIATRFRLYAPLFSTRFNI